MSASAGGLTMPSEMASAMETMRRAPFAWARLGDGGDVLDGAEEVGRLDEDAGGVGGDGGFEGGHVDAAV